MTTLKSPIPRRLQSLLTALILFASVLGVSVGVTSTADAAANKSVVVGMPFAGKWASNESGKPSTHDRYWGQWSEDLFAFNTDVYLHVSAPDGGSLSFVFGYNHNSCAGKGVVIYVYLDGVNVGGLYYEHLNNVVTNGPITNGMKLGTTLASGTNVAPCFYPSGNQGVHTHFEAMSDSGNYACWNNFAIGSQLSVGTAIGKIGKTNATGVGQECTGTSGSGSSAYADGTVVRASDTGRIYIMAGGAPMYVSSWANVGGSKPVNVSLTQAQVNALPDYPKDGSVIRSGTTGRIYIMAGGAPMYVSSWANVGGSKPLTTIDQWAITNQLRQFPLEGTYLRGYTTGSIYVTAGGAPMYISGWSAVGGSHSVVSVDQSAISVLPDYPDDGTYLRNYATGGIYIIVGGAPMYVTSSANVPAGKSINVDEGVFSHQLREYPADGTYVKNYSTGVGYVIAGGAPLGITSWSAVGGPFPYTYVDGWAIANQLLQYPVDGTFVRGYTSKRIYGIQDQEAVYISDPSLVTSTPVSVDDWAIDNVLLAQ